jgi:hypothetical protein
MVTRRAFISGTLAASLATRAEAWTTDVKAYGAKGDGVADDTTAINATIASFNSNMNRLTGVVYVPPGTYSVSQILVRPGVSLCGAGIAPLPQNATLFVQKNGINKSCIVNDPAFLGTTDYWHWSELKNFCVTKAAGSTDRLGSGIELNCRTGEGFKIEHVQVEHMPQHGISFLHGGAPLYLEDLHLEANNGYGLNLVRAGGDVWQTVHVTLLSGDDNAKGLVYIKNTGDVGEGLYFEGIKAEIDNPGRQSNLFVLDGTYQTPVWIHNASVNSTGPKPNAIVRIINSGGLVALSLVRAGGAAQPKYLIDNPFAGRRIPFPTGSGSTLLSYAYSDHANGEIFRLDASGVKFVLHP